jgi:hypothetical protein
MTANATARRSGICWNNREKKEDFMWSEAGLLVFGQAVPAINRPAFSWLEGDLALFSTV